MSATGWAAGDYLDRPLRDLLADVAGSDPVPAAGSMVATVGALAAGLTAKIARRSVSQLPDAAKIAARADGLRAQLEPLITADAAGYAKALLEPDDPSEMTAAMLTASSGPILVAETAAEIAEIAAMLAKSGNPNLRHDAAAAAWLASSVVKIAADLTSANLGWAAAAQGAHAAALQAQAAADNARRQLGLPGA